MIEVFESDKKSASGVVFAGECILASMKLGTDGVNNPTITVYDGVDNTGEEVVPTTEYDASVLGMNGYVGPAIRCKKGIFVEIGGVGIVEVVTAYKDRNLLGVN